MLYTYKFRIYPTKAQELLLEQTLETCRRLYNVSLDERIKNYHLTYYDQQNQLPEIRNEDKYLKQVHSQVLQNVLLRLDKAYQAFYKRLAKHPTFRRQDKYNSFTYPQYGGFKLQNNRTVLSRIGCVKIRMHRIPIGTLKTCTIIRDIDQWYACIVSDNHVVTNKIVQSNNAVGIDLGLLHLATLSTGEIIENPKHISRSIQRIKRLQRNLSKKHKGSKNRDKARIALAKEWRKVRRQRDDYAHKVSTNIANSYNIVVFEKLTVNNMVKNHTLASAIMDATWGKLRQLTAYKVEGRGGNVIVVSPNGTSQKCSRCGCAVQKDLSVRIHKCPDCGLVINREHNAALNILKLGLEQTHAEAEPLLVRRISKSHQGSKKLAPCR